MKFPCHRILAVVFLSTLLLPTLACAAADPAEDTTITNPPATTADLSPAAWEEGELDKYLELNNIFREPKPLATSTRGMVSGTVDAPAVRAGLEALNQGGSAADAALTTALTQICLLSGSTISYAGILTMVYYDAAMDRVYAMDAGFNTVLEETDPLTIPTAAYMSPGQKAEPGPKGRTVLVPGFMAGVEAAHKRFGKLPFDQIFAPAIFFAEEGFRFTSKLERYLKYREKILSRLPETKAVFLKDDGAFYSEGDLFTQPALAKTLRKVASEGAQYMYSGAWAEKFVKAVQRDGGKLTMKDMTGYQPAWREPAHVSYRGHDINIYHEAWRLCGMLNLLDASNLSSKGHYTKSPETFFWFTRILRAVTSSPFLTNAEATEGGFDWLDRKTAAKVWKQIEEDAFPGLPALEDKSPGHSAAVVAKDEAGNVAAVLHSIGTAAWGENGLIIDGVSIPDAATYQQYAIQATGPGNRLPNGTAPLIVLQNGKPVMTASCIGTGIYPETLKVLFNALDFGMNAKQVLDSASFLVPDYGPEGYSDHERVVQEEFSAELLEGVRKLGLTIDEIPPLHKTRGSGSAVCIFIDPETGCLEGCAPSYSNGLALGL
ncbi:MAG: gamma-glutamyltransferase [Planctomycetota bacterium]|jgi:gamma-glutamyltranspeptidase/glutathione hydrolase